MASVKRLRPSTRWICKHATSHTMDIHMYWDFWKLGGSQYAFAIVNHKTLKSKKHVTCDVNYWFYRISTLYHSVFEMRNGNLWKMKCCVFNSVEYILALQPSWSRHHDHLKKLLFPCPLEAHIESNFRLLIYKMQDFFPWKCTHLH